jgi:hypothetical protein
MQQEVAGKPVYFFSPGRIFNPHNDLLQYGLIEAAKLDLDSRRKC